MYGRYERVSEGETDGEGGKRAEGEGEGGSAKEGKSKGKRRQVQQGLGGSPGSMLWSNVASGVDEEMQEDGLDDMGVVEGGATLVMVGGEEEVAGGMIGRRDGKRAAGHAGARARVYVGGSGGAAGERWDGEDSEGAEGEEMGWKAFEVSGEPNFEHDSPLDGFEYLRRVK